MRARRFCAHVGSSAISKSLQVHNGPANITAHPWSPSLVLHARCASVSPVCGESGYSSDASEPQHDVCGVADRRYSFAMRAGA